MKFIKEDYHEEIEITYKKTLRRGMHVMVCPKCEKTNASAESPKDLPKWASCIGGKLLSENEINALSKVDKLFYKGLFLKVSENKFK